MFNKCLMLFFIVLVFPTISQAEVIHKHYVKLGQHSHTYKITYESQNDGTYVWLQYDHKGRLIGHLLGCFVDETVGVIQSFSDHGTAIYNIVTAPGSTLQRPMFRFAVEGG